eukprot:TRINITY_DN7325_c0_g1_i1.p1 TRINITY_DN7325_c0_g1~~TRINITY_DN7325_c0_g1_i1.p1  ORF type:complete len:153 (-),score=29.62 TRINITY_DN7325_c0_g1_i1:738-1196(-)
MLYSTNIVAVVGRANHPIFACRRLTLWNTNTSRSQLDLPFTSAILAVKMNRKSLIVILNERIEVYTISTMTKVFTINGNFGLGRFALSAGSKTSYLALSTSILSGAVTLYNLLTRVQEKEVAAHYSPIVMMAYNKRGSMLATLSCNVLCGRL